MDRDVIIKKLKEYYENNTKNAFVYLFGSYAMGRNNKNSDIDIAVNIYTNQVNDLFEYKVEETIQLQNLLKKNVDIVILNNASPILVNQVFRYGVLIKCFDKKLLTTFRVMYFYKYLDQVHMSNIIFQKNKQNIKELTKNG